MNKLAQFSSVREFITDVNSAYRCIAFVYFEGLLSEKNVNKISEIVNEVWSRRVELQSV